MRYALISDIHSNLYALQSVLADMESLNVDRVICLGDIIGYGPNPVETLALMRKKVNYFIMGNHDAVIAGVMSSALFNDAARQAIEWTYNQLSPRDLLFFRSLPHEIQGDGFRMTHGEFVVPQRYGYVFDEHDALSSMGAVPDPLLFIGHSHVPLFFSYCQGDAYPVVHAAESFEMAEGTRYLVNVGSVGQSRDGDIRACYCIYDDKTKQVLFRHVAYDVEAYKRDICRTGLPKSPIFFDSDTPMPAAQDDFYPEAEEKIVQTKRSVRTLVINPSGQAVRLALASVVVLLILFLAVILTAYYTPPQVEFVPDPNAAFVVGTEKNSRASGVIPQKTPNPAQSPSTPPFTVTVDSVIVSPQPTSLVMSTHSVLPTLVDSSLRYPVQTHQNTSLTVAAFESFWSTEHFGFFPFCKAGNGFRVESGNGLDYWAVSLVASRGQSVEFLSDGSLGISSDTMLSIRLFSVPVNVDTSVEQWMVTPSADCSEMTSGSLTCTVFIDGGTGITLPFNTITPLMMSGKKTFRIEVSGCFCGKVRLNPFKIFPASQLPLKGSEYVSSPSLKTWFKDRIVLDDPEKGPNRKMDLTPSAAAPGNWTLRADSSVHVSDSEGALMLTAGTSSEVEMVSAPMKFNWKSANLYVIIVKAELLGLTRESRFSCSLAVELPDGRLWCIEQRKLHGDISLQMTVPRKLIPDDDSAYRLRLILNGEIEGSLRISDIHIQRF